jgi:transposase
MSLRERIQPLSRDEIVSLLEEVSERSDALAAQNAELQQQLDWLKRQLFGPSSERRVFQDPDARQLAMGEAFTMHTEASSAPTITVPGHARRRPQDPSDRASESSHLRYDSSVPVEEIEIPNPEISSLPPDSYDIVGEKITERLAQRRGSYVVLVYKRKVAKRKDTGAFSCPEAPAAVFDKSIADVSFIAGLVIDKFRFALPLYRQHQRLAETGVHISRSTLTLLVQRAALLLEPIYEALQTSVLASKLLLMDETPIKAGHKRTQKGSGKMKTGYFWPVYGDQSEIVFPFSSSRSHQVVEEILGDFNGTLLTDGYEAYERFDSKVRELTHALCWSHARRYFVKAEGVEPELANKGLDFIAELYRHEATIRSRGLTDVKKLEARAELCRPVVERFFEWLNEVHLENLLLPSNPLTKAASYALEREAGLRVFLDDPDVPLDTNGLEREIRPLAIGRKNWLFAWTEVGARYVGIFHSLIATCRLHNVDPYTYLVDVLQRVATHPAKDVGQLTPRLWKALFESNPLRSDLDRGQHSVR